jgi:hypothetical protein
MKLLAKNKTLELKEGWRDGDIIFYLPTTFDTKEHESFNDLKSARDILDEALRTEKMNVFGGGDL